MLHPDSTLISLHKLQQLLRWHLYRLKLPWEPFKLASNSKRATLNASTLTIPNTAVQLAVDEASRNISIHMSDRTGIDEIDCLLLTKSYDYYAVDEIEGEEEGKLDRLSYWYAAEALAVPQILVALCRLSSSGAGERAEMAVEIRSEAVEDESSFVEGLFRAFSGLAQKQLEGTRRSTDALFWRVQLRFSHRLDADYIQGDPSTPSTGRTSPITLPRPLIHTQSPCSHV